MTDFPLTGASYYWKKPGRGSTHKVYDIPEIPMLPDGWATEHIMREGYPVYRAMILDESPAPICAPEDNAKGAHHWKCGGFCSFANTAGFCPDPATEWAALQKGASPTEAFSAASDALVQLQRRTAPEGAD